MNARTLNIINSYKNEAFKNALLSHGLGTESAARKTVDFINAHPEIRNSTEPRMTLYSAEINEYLYSDNSFVTLSTNDAQFAASGETKALNDAAAGPTVTKGRFYATTLANGDNAPTKTVTVRKNSYHEWSIEYFHVDPQSLTFELTSEVAYDARQDLLKAHADVLKQSKANYTAVEWAQGSISAATTVDTAAENNYYIFTSDTNTRSSSVVNNTTTTVAKIGKTDMQNVKKAFQRQNILKPGSKIYCLPTVEQYNDILEIDDFISFEKTGRESRLIKGEVGVLYNMTILEPRQNDTWNANVLYSYTALSGTNTDLTKVEDDADAAAGMTSAMLCWVKDQVLRADGKVVVFPWMNSPIYMGDVYGSEMRYGSIKKRGDNKGVVMLLENPF